MKAIATLLWLAFVASIVGRIWTDDMRWVWTAVVLLVAAFIASIIATPEDPS